MPLNRLDLSPPNARCFRIVEKFLAEFSQSCNKPPKAPEKSVIQKRVYFNLFVALVLRF